MAILEARDYAAPLAEIVRRGLNLFDLPVRGKTVVLKPNFVEYDNAGVINTHPRVVAAAIDAFRTLGARHVIVAEGLATNETPSTSSRPRGWRPFSRSTGRPTWT